MSDFASSPPSTKRLPLDGFFQGGMVPPEQNFAAMIIMDLRSLRLTPDQGKELESDLREYLLKRLHEMNVDLADRSYIDLNSSVFGISIE